MLTSLVLNGRAGDTPLDVTPFVEDYDFPNATPNAWGDDLMDAGVTHGERALNDAPWSLTLTPHGFANQAAVSAYLQSVAALLVPGSTVAIAEDDCPAATATIKRRSQQSRTCQGTGGRVSYTGTRWPGWGGRIVPFGPLTLPLFGTVDLDSVPDGDIEAIVDLSATTGSAMFLGAIGIKADPATGYDPIDDYTAATNNLAAGVQEVIETAPSIEVNANRGYSQLIARVTGNDSTTEIVGQSTVTPTIGDEYSEPNPPVTLGAMPTNGYQVLDLGRVSLPVQDVPDLAVESGYGTEVTLVNVTTGTSIQLQSGHKVGQTFTMPSGSVLSFIKFNNLPTNCVMKVYAWTGTTTGAMVYSATGNNSYPHVALAEGTYILVLETYNPNQTRPSVLDNTSAPSAGGAGYVFNGSTWAAGDGTDATVDWGVTIKSKPILTFGAKTPVLAETANASKTAGVDIVARIPLDVFAVIFRRAAYISSGQGFRVNSATKTAYLVNSSGAAGASLSGSIEVLGLRPGFAPGVVNRFVGAGQTAATETGINLTLSGTYTEQWLDKARAV